MNRRQFLGSTSVVVTPSLVGCLGEGSEPESTESGDSDDEASNWTDVYPARTDDLNQYDPAATAKEIEIGTSEDVDSLYQPPPEVRIWNVAGHSTFDLVLLDTISGTVVHDETYEIPADEELHLTVWEPSAYLYEVAVPDADLSQVLGLPCLMFDCNEQVTRIGLFDDDVRSDGYLTVVGCGSYCAEETDVDREDPYGNHTEFDA